MGAGADRTVGHWFARRLAIFFFALLSIFFLTPPASAQDTALMRRGDAAVTAFSGAKQIGAVPADLHPLDLTFIDVNGATLQVFDLTALGGAPDGQIAHAPVKFKARAGEIGQVFGVALDGDNANATPNIYATFTSLFGLQIVSAEGDRLVKGEPGARWMPGQLGKGGTPGSVWKIDGVTGAISLFANIQHDGKDNAGPGLGDIAYDPTTHQLFVSDLETGLIHRLDMDGNDLGTFDHGVTARPTDDLEPVAYDGARRMNIESPGFDIEKPSTWGFADKARMVFAVAVQNGRLYYSAEGPQIWSVGIDSDGGFADDARFEIAVEDTPAGNMVTDITFDGAGALYLAQRGELVGSYDYGTFAKPESSVVLRYVWDETEKEWSQEPEEYAVGLKEPHRSTVGGVALSYGYDADGKIDYNQCRATLWTTGEHLREGEETERVYAGGARIVHGLQGNDKSLVRPANEPPFDAWFVDNDGLYLDADVNGHVGDIAIFNPCDKRTVAEAEPLPYPLPFPYYPPLPEPGEEEEPEGPGIFIDKVCEPAIFGGEIHCIITVTNIGETLSDPVDIWDAATILSGPGAGGGIIIAGVAPDGPDWVCSPTPTPDLWCSLPPDAIEPGETRSIDVWIDTGPLFLAGDFGFRNCAVLEAPWDDIACDDGGTDITVEKTAPAACDPGGDCTFTVTITNDGTLGFTGDVLLTDAMFFPDGTGIPAPITAMVPDLGCVPPPGALDFSCVAPLTLGPGESVAFAITVTMPAMPAMYWAQNCFAISTPGLAPPALPLAPGTEADNASCAWVPVGGPPPLSNIRVDKTALDGGQCYKLPGDNIGCDYEIAFINDGPSPFHGLLSFTDAFPAGSLPGGIIPAPWVCAIPPLACDIPAGSPVDIAVGESIVFPITLATPLATIEAAGCTMTNTATLTAPAAGTDENFFGGDDTDGAAADAWMQWVMPWGGILETCDPTNLKVTKVAQGDCVASDAGYRCDYEVTITNMGPDPYKGPLEIDEQFGFAPSTVTFPPEWGHSGGGALFQLTHPPLELAKGDSIKFSVSATVPEGKQCGLKNTASLTVPDAPTRWNKDASDDTATAWAKIPSETCVRPERPQCEPKTNEFRSESGACVCKSGFVRDQKGECVKIAETPLCPDGKPVPKSGHCPTTPTACVPGPNEVRTPENKCVCKSGYERDKRGNCVKEPTTPELCEPGPNEVRTPQNKCVCKSGYERDKRGNCVKPEPACIPGPNEIRNDKGQCVCKSGYERDKRGNCVKPVPQCVPGPNEIRNDKGQCVCKSGFERDKNGRCVTKPTTPEACGANETRNDKGKCVCQAGYERDKRGNCVKKANPADECKKKGWIWNDKRKSCTPPLKPVTPEIKPVDPAVLCKAKGWVWDGRTCQPPGQSTVPR